MKPNDVPDIDALVRRFDIPPCPAVIGELRQELASEHASAATVAKLISRDVGLSGAVMRIVNSPAFHTGRKAASITEALAMLGFGRVFDLVVGQLMRHSLGAGDGVRLDRYWDSAACGAAVSAALAGRLRGTSRETAYCFGLFHDCGIPLLMRRFPDYRQTLQAANGESGAAMLAIEESRYGTSHVLVGYLLGRTWGLSETLCEAIRCHHDYDIVDPATPSGYADEVCTLVAIGALAEHIADVHLRTREERQWAIAREKVRAFFGLSTADLDDLVEDLLHELQSGRLS